MPAERPGGRAGGARVRPRWNVKQVKIAAAIEVNQATIARFEDGIAWPRQPEEVLIADASEPFMDVRLLWLRAFVLWIEHEPVLDKQSQEDTGGGVEVPVGERREHDFTISTFFSDIARQYLRGKRTIARRGTQSHRLPRR